MTQSKSGEVCTTPSTFLALDLAPLNVRLSLHTDGVGTNSRNGWHDACKNHCSLPAPQQRPVFSSSNPLNRSGWKLSNKIFSGFHGTTHASLPALLFSNKHAESSLSLSITHTTTHQRSSLHTIWYSLKLIINKLPHDYSTHSTIYLTAHHDQIHSLQPQAPLSRQRFPLPYRRLVVAHTPHNVRCSWLNRNHHRIRRLLHPRRACPLHSCLFNCGRRYHC